MGFYFFQKSPESRFLSVFPFDNAHFTPKIFRRAFGAHFSSISPWYTAGNFSSTKTILFYWFSLVNLTVFQKIFALRAKNDRGFLFFSDFDLGKNTRGFLFFSKISEINRPGFLFKGGRLFSIPSVVFRVKIPPLLLDVAKQGGNFYQISPILDTQFFSRLRRASEACFCYFHVL